MIIQQLKIGKLNIVMNISPRYNYRYAFSTRYNDSSQLQWDSKFKCMEKVLCNPYLKHIKMHGRHSISQAILSVMNYIVDNKSSNLEECKKELPLTNKNTNINTFNNDNSNINSNININTDCDASRCPSISLSIIEIEGNLRIDAINQFLFGMLNLNQIKPIFLIVNVIVRTFHVIPHLAKHRSCEKDIPFDALCSNIYQLMIVTKLPINIKITIDNFYVSDEKKLVFDSYFGEKHLLEKYKQPRSDVVDCVYSPMSKPQVSMDVDKRYNTCTFHVFNAKSKE